MVDLVVLFVCANRSSQCNKHLQSSSYTGIKSCPPSIAKSREVWYWCHYQPEPHIQHLQVNATAVGMHSQRQEIRPHCTLWSMRHDLAMQASPVNSYSFLLRTWQCAYLYHLVVPPCSCCNFSLPQDCIVLLTPILQYQMSIPVNNSRMNRLLLTGITYTLFITQELLTPYIPFLHYRKGTTKMQGRITKSHTTPYFARTG